MQLADFILDNVEPILAEFETFARAIWPLPITGKAGDPAMLRDHAEAILRATVADMRSVQTEPERADKSRGDGRGSTTSRRMNLASVQHGEDRNAHHFELALLVSEYRALRASVLRLWRASTPVADSNDLDDFTRFNESIDQSLTAAVGGYAEAAKETAAALVAEQAARLGAETASRDKDTFLRTLSHELRTPLHSVVLSLAMLRREGLTPAALAEGLAIIERSTRAQVRLVDDILDVSAIVSGKFHVDRARHALHGPVTEAVDALRAEATGRGVRLELLLGPAPIFASCDPVRIRQLVWNLVSNAIKFTPPGLRVGVTLAPEGSAARIEVRDAGRGIEAAFLPFLFDRFRQFDGSTTRSAGGLGLGLAIARHIVDAHGGTIDVYSAGTDAGATFTVFLPAADA